jgi:hypothetical protein
VNTNVQFNDSGAFGGDTGFTFDKTAKTVTLGGGTLTANAPVLDLSQTWNNDAVTFTGFRLNAAGTSDANSAAASLLLQLQVGGSSRFEIYKTGSLNFSGSFNLNINGTPYFRLTTANTRIVAAASYEWSSSGVATDAGDLFLTRRGTANLRLGAADAASPVPQILSVQSVVAVGADQAGANFTITGSQGRGGGAGGSIIFQVAPAGTAGSGVQNALSTALTILSTRTVEFSNGFQDSVGFFGGRAGSGLWVVSTGRLALGGDFAGPFLRYDGATNLLAQRDGTTAQTFRVYNSFTDASNYSRLAINANQIRSEVLGTGSLAITADAPVLDLAQTWNNAAVTFTGLKFNVTATAFATGSTFLDFQKGGTRQFAVRDDGRIYSVLIGNSTTFGTDPAAIFFSGANVIHYISGGEAFRTTSTGIQLPPGCSVNWNTDTFLTRKDTRNLRLGQADAATALAQTFSVQSVVAGTTNGAGANFTITGSQGTGSGAGGSIIFQVAPASVTSGTVQNALVNALTIAGNGKITTAPVASGDCMSIGGNANFNLNGTQLTIGNVQINGNGGGFVTVSDTGLVRWGASADVILARDAANTLALRNGANAQTFRVYETFTDASNYARAFIRAPAGASAEIGTEGAGTGSSTRSLVITVGGTQRWQFQGSSGNLRAVADNAVDIGGAADNRPRDIYAAGTVSPGRGVTVAGLPTPSTGMMARVTDATMPIVGSTVVGGGAAAALVWYNGANWTVIGV